jgi:hypothetical protein
MEIGTHLERELQEPLKAYKYCSHISPHPELEKVIIKDSSVALLYAEYVLNGRFELAERTCFRKPWVEVNTARYILFLYCRYGFVDFNFLGPYILKTPLTALLYVILKERGRNKEAELTFLKNDRRSKICREFYMEYLEKNNLSSYYFRSELHLRDFLCDLFIELKISYKPFIN